MRRIRTPCPSPPGKAGSEEPKMPARLAYVYLKKPTLRGKVSLPPTAKMPEFPEIQDLRSALRERGTVRKT